jgi:hypothetical protein
MLSFVLYAIIYRISMCICVHMCLSLYACKGQLTWVPPLTAIHLIIYRGQVSLLSQSLSSARITSKPPRSPGLYLGSVNLTSGPHVFMTSTLPTEPSFQAHTLSSIRARGVYGWFSQTIQASLSLPGWSHTWWSVSSHSGRREAENTGGLGLQLSPSAPLVFIKAWVGPWHLTSQASAHL